MSNSISVLKELLQIFPYWRTQMYFKSSLTALSHAMEDQVLAGSGYPLVITSFQRERFYRQEIQRYRRIYQKTAQVYVLSSPEVDFENSSEIYETITFEPTDSLAQEWNLIIISQDYASCLVCQESIGVNDNNTYDLIDLSIENVRCFEGIWTFDRQVSQQAADILLRRVLVYRPELKTKINQARQAYLPEIALKEGGGNLKQKEVNNFTLDCPDINPDPFVKRLVSYLQASQYKLLKANRSLASKEHKERLINSVTIAIRHSLDPEKILHLAVQKLGKGLGVCRCLVYRCRETDTTATIQHEFLNAGIASIKGKTWPLHDNPLFQEVMELHDALMIENTNNDPRIFNRTKSDSDSKSLRSLVTKYSILSWLLVPILYRGRLLGMLELHHCGPNPMDWKDEDVDLVNAITTQIGVALIQAETYANLQDLNEQLEALDHTRSNLVAITGHELRTPLSTIQICLESLATEPYMSPELRQVMLNTALQDAERMRKLVQDFLTLSQLESGRVEWHPEPLDLAECVELSLSNVKAGNRDNNLPNIKNLVTSELPLIQADGEWLVEVLAKLLDNACKFTSSKESVTIKVSSTHPASLEVTVADTGRGIEPDCLETVFDLFYQEEGALQRSTGGTGLGLAICRQIVQGWGGEIWAESDGKDLGSQFHFTVPIFLKTIPCKTTPPAKTSKSKNSRRRSSE